MKFIKMNNSLGSCYKWHGVTVPYQDKNSQGLVNHSKWSFLFREFQNKIWRVGWQIANLWISGNFILIVIFQSSMAAVAHMVVFRVFTRRRLLLRRFGESAASICRVLNWVHVNFQTIVRISVDWLICVLTTLRLCEIWGSHSGIIQDSSLLG